jgi:GLPGLI family protein
MKRLISISLLFLFFCPVLKIQAQKRLTEATITYDIIVSTSNSNPQAADLLDGATNIIYLKGNSSRSELISSLGTQSTIIDGKTGQVTILKDYGEQKYMITMTAENWLESNKKYEGVSFIFQDDFKTIAGYKCQKAIGKLVDGTEFSVYFTRDLLPVNRDFQYINRNLPGLAMQYEATLGTMMVVYTITSINLKPVPAQKLDLPKSGYRVMTYEESLKAGDEEE